MSGLLDRILEKSGMDYLSDLREKIEDDRVKEAISQISVSDYEVAEWVEAVDYLSGVHGEFHSVDEVQSYVEKLK